MASLYQGPMAADFGSIAIITPNNGDPAPAEFKSVAEQSLLAALRLMEECYRYLDTFMATIAPTDGKY